MTVHREPPDKRAMSAEALKSRIVDSKSARPIEGTLEESKSSDGLLQAAISIVPGDESQVAAFSGRLESTAAIAFCLDTLRALFTATPPTAGTSTIYIRDLKAASEEGLDALVDAVRTRHYDEDGTVELRLELSPVVAELLQRLHPPSWHTTLDWDVDDVCLVVKLQKQGARQRPK